MKYSRPVNGEILSVTIRRENTDQYYAVINVKKSIIEVKPKTGKSIGIDLGLKDSVTCSTGFKSGKILLAKFDHKSQD
ncbi:MAG: hypothetical protein LBC39_08995 [Methanobrevibacter sp.]|jgi:putative transposase|nr:hypothetical protein [Candidatus Methanovirga aequatorialis]